MVRRLPSKHRNAPVGRVKDKDAFLRLALLLGVGLALACGFVYAGRQHFAALKYGYETEKLRSERDQLAEAQRRLTLQRDQAANPVRLEQLAKQLGMQTLQPAQIDPLRQGTNNSRTAQTLAVSANAKPAKKDAEKNLKPGAKPAAKTQRKPI